MNAVDQFPDKCASKQNVHILNPSPAPPAWDSLG
jgi:hypothetical protein